MTPLLTALRNVGGTLGPPASRRHVYCNKHLKRRSRHAERGRPRACTGMPPRKSVPQFLNPGPASTHERSSRSDAIAVQAVLKCKRLLRNTTHESQDKMKQALQELQLAGSARTDRHGSRAHAWF